MKIKNKRTLSDYLKQIECKTSDYGTYAFRGQENIEWPLLSSATRRLCKYYNKELDIISNFQKLYIDYHKDVLLDPARLNGFGIEKGRDLSDLEILVKLQHFGAATGLLDFTKNRIIALWFACQNESYDGKVFIINTASLKHFANITYEQTKEKITKILLPKRTVPFIWEPAALGEPMARIIRQHSLFVVGKHLPPINPNAIDVVTIAKENKKELLQEIKETFDIDKNSIFKDFYGFATVNKSTSDIPLFHSSTNYFELGNISYQQKEHNEAIRYYSRAIDLKSDFFEAYYNRGNSYAACKAYKKAMDDYDVVIDYIENREGKQNISWWASLCMLYFNKANCYAACENHQKAIENYNLYIKTFRFHDCVSVKPGVYFNQGNSVYCLGDYHDAIQAYEKCIEIDKKYTAAWYNKGNTEVLLFQFDEAKKSYTMALKVNPSNEHAKLNLNVVESIIQNPKKERNYLFAGNKGNMGMFCGINKLSNELSIHTIDLYGANDGFEGYEGFKLLHLNGKWKRVLMK